MIDYLVPHKYLDYDLNRAPGLENPGGGVATKIQRVFEVANQRWYMSLISEIEECRAPVLIVEPLWASVGSKPLEECVEALAAYFEAQKFIEQKILYCTELDILQWPNGVRQKFLELFDVVTFCCDYQRGLFRAYNISSCVCLCDPVPERVFFPASQKERLVVGVGKISWKKNSEGLIELFRMLSDSKYESVYLGGVTMWGDSESEYNSDLERELRAVTQHYVGNVRQQDVAYYLSRAAFFVHAAYHDTNSESQLEAALSGCVTLALGHPTMRGRGDFTELGDVRSMADAILGFSDEDIRAAGVRSRSWALERCSYEVFFGSVGDDYKVVAVRL